MRRGVESLVRLSKESLIAAERSYERAVDNTARVTGNRTGAELLVTLGIFAAGMSVGTTLPVKNCPEEIMYKSRRPSSGG